MHRFEFHPIRGSLVVLALGLLAHSTLNLNMWVPLADQSATSGPPWIVQLVLSAVGVYMTGALVLFSAGVAILAAKDPSRVF